MLLWLSLCLLHLGYAFAQESTAECPKYLGTGENGLPRCDMNKQDYLVGQWKRIPRQCRPKSFDELATYAYPYVYDCNPASHQCLAEDDICHKKAFKIVEWSWYPELCSLEAFDAHKLSHRLGPRYVLLIGDSLMVQQFAALAAIMRQAVSDATDPQPDWEHFYTVDGGMFQLEGIQFFVGKPIDATVNQSLEVLPGTAWVQMVENADIVVLNTGHHWHRRDEEFKDWKLMQRNVLTAMKASFRGSHIIFRSTTWGHHSCDSIIKPLDNETQAMNAMETDPYKWMRPIQSDHQWEQTADEVGMGDMFRVVNSSITMLRGDAHVDRKRFLNGGAFTDCLHNCWPGPPDWWNLILYNTLMSLDLHTPPRSQKPVNHVYSAAMAAQQADVVRSDAKLRADVQQVQAAKEAGVSLATS